jgi:hypothetical protein
MSAHWNLALAAAAVFATASAVPPSAAPAVAVKPQIVAYVFSWYDGQPLPGTLVQATSGNDTYFALVADDGKCDFGTVDKGSYFVAPYHPYYDFWPASAIVEVDEEVNPLGEATFLAF